MSLPQLKNLDSRQTLSCLKKNTIKPRATIERRLFFIHLYLFQYHTNNNARLVYVCTDCEQRSHSAKQSQSVDFLLLHHENNYTNIFGTDNAA